MSDVERVVLIGGPLDGQEHMWPVGLGLIRIPLRVEGEDHDTQHEYGQADAFDPPEGPGFSPDGARRYVYMGQH